MQLRKDRDPVMNFLAPSALPAISSSKNNYNQRVQKSGRFSCSAVAPVTYQVSRNASAVSTAAIFWDAVCKILDGTATTDTIELVQEMPKNVDPSRDKPPTQLAEVLDAVSKTSLEIGIRVQRDIDEYSNYVMSKGKVLANEMEAVNRAMKEEISSTTELGNSLQAKFEFLNRELRTIAEVLCEMEEWSNNRVLEEPPAVQMVPAMDENFVSKIILKLTSKSNTATASKMTSFLTESERNSNIAAAKAFVRELIVPYGICPYTTSEDWAAVGTALKRQGISPGPVLYPVSDATSSESLFRDFFKTAESLLSTPETKASTVLLLAPKFASSNFAEFASFTVGLENMLLRSCAKNEIGFVAFHPDYDRNMVQPRNELTSGHLPPAPFLKSFLHLYCDIWDDNNDLTECANYARRSPQPMINILRGSHLAAIDKEALFPQQKIYAVNARRLSQTGKDILEGLGRKARSHLFGQN